MNKVIQEVYGAFAIIVTKTGSSVATRFDYDCDGDVVTIHQDGVDVRTSHANPLAPFDFIGALRMLAARAARGEITYLINDHASVHEHGGPCFTDGDADFMLVFDDGSVQSLTTQHAIRTWINKLI